ncbi:MAG TPA: ABC transporter ATP-binding protein [Candidatus Angelobacter sp.]|nr:ABC transporter ATP-binding protein [Candidatus Angelobacter sp.]
MTASEPAAIVAVEELRKAFGPVVALDGVSLAIGDNEFFALLGPSGCGKTTLLRCLAGFEQPDSGRILLDGEEISRVPPYRRPFNMMFQSYALFPHMSVDDNVAYGLRQEKVREPELGRRVADALEMVQLGGMGRRRPHQLSGGQRQRVALARALVKRPRLLLLDEPLAALDRKLRGQMQLELKRLQETVGISFVIVTHDQEEALVMADRAAIMDRGRVLQLAAPDELYERPATRFVATFVGESNLLRGRLAAGDGGLRLETSGRALAVDPAAAEARGLSAGDTAALAIRPERIGFVADGGEPAEVSEVAYLGSNRRYAVDLADGTSLVVRVQAGSPGDDLVVGDRVRVAWRPEHAVLVVDDAKETA